MTTPSEPRTPGLYHAWSIPTVSALAAVALALAGVATALLAGSIAYAAGLALVPAIATGQLAMLAVTVAAVIATRRAWTPPSAAMMRAVVGLARPRWHAVAGAAGLGGSAWYLNQRVAGWLAHAVPRTTEGSAALERLANTPGLAYTLLTVALLPAVAEEILFRGVLARGLASRLGWPLAALLAAATFAGYHLNLTQLVPTFLLGGAFAAIAIRAGSAVPTILAHAINNAIAIVLSRPEGEAAATAIHGHPRLALAIAATLSAGGLALALGAPGPRYGALAGAVA